MFPITSVIRNVTVRLRSSLGTTEIPLGLHVVIVNLVVDGSTQQAIGHLGDDFLLVNPTNYVQNCAVKR